MNPIWQPFLGTYVKNTITQLLNLHSYCVYLTNAIEYVFRYLEDLALASGMMQHIKLLQGLTVAAETLVGEIIFFPLSGEDNLIHSLQAD